MIMEAQKHPSLPSASRGPREAAGVMSVLRQEPEVPGRQAGQQQAE